MNVAPGATYEAVIDWGTSGATLGMRVIDNAGATSVARLTTSIVEYPSGSGIYARTGNVAPSTAGTTVPQIQAALVAEFNAYQARITAANPWQRYGTSYDGTSWTAVSNG